MADHMSSEHLIGCVGMRTRGQVLAFLSEQPHCIVAMEACATAHDWAREIGKIGHTTKLIPPQYVKPYVKRQKNDSADAEAITEAVSRRNMRFVEVKTEDQQVSAMSYRTRQMFIGQRTQTINALRSHLSEHGVVTPKSKAGVRKLVSMIEDDTVIISEKIREILGSSFKCNTQSPLGIGCCDGHTKQAPQQRGTWRDISRA